MRQRRRHVAQGAVGNTAVDVSRGREWRMHQHDARTYGGVEAIVDVGGIVPGHTGVCRVSSR
jgi:hypothetical protein